MSQATPPPIAGLGKSVLIGGGAAGLLSVFPVVNLLNLFFMAWILLGAGLTIQRLYRLNPSLRRGDALLAGALSGLTGGGLFALLGFVSVAGLTQEKLDRMVESTRALAPFLAEGPEAALSSGQFKTLMVIAICLFLLLAIAAGAVAGLAARRLLDPARRERP